MTETKLRPEDLDVMYRHAEREFPDESCGIIVGRAGDPSVTEVRPCTNIQHELKEKYPEQFSRDADTGYYIDPKEMMTIFNDAGKRGLDVIGFYHSHPNHDAYWSQEDHRAAMFPGSDEPSYPDAFHVVVSIYDGKVKGASMFIWNPDTGKFDGQAVEG